MRRKVTYEVHEYENTAEDRPDYKHVASTASYVGARTHEPDASLRKRDGVAVAAFEDGVFVEGEGHARLEILLHSCLQAVRFGYWYEMTESRA